MKQQVEIPHSKVVPAGVAIPLSAFIAFSPIALVVELTGEADWHDYLIPAAMGELLAMAYWLLYIRRVEKSLPKERNLLRVLIDHLPDRISHLHRTRRSTGGSI